MSPGRAVALAVATCVALAACSGESADPTTLPPLTSATTTAAATTTTSTPRSTSSTAATSSTTATTSSTTSSVPGRGLYTVVPGPRLPDVTAPIDPAWIGADGETLGGIADGAYWAIQQGVGTGAEPFVDLQLVQAFFGSACTDRFGSGDDVCANDYGIVETPSGSFPAPASTPYVTVVDEATKDSYLVDGNELLGLASGRSPAAAAPTDFFYVPFPFLVTVKGGAVVSLEQVWVP